MRAKIVGVLLASAALAADKDDAKTASDWLNLARKHYGNRRFDDAQTAVDKCLAMDKDNVRALELRGFVHFMRGKFKESVADFDRQIKLRPKDANGHWQRGISLYY